MWWALVFWMLRVLAVIWRRLTFVCPDELGFWFREKPAIPSRLTLLQVLAPLFLLLQVLALLIAAPQIAHAQLATSFYNVTGIETKRLPNAVQVTIRTDGAVSFGGDIAQWAQDNNGDGDFSPKSTARLRLRLLNARSRVPAFVDLGAYPFDSAQVTLGRDELVRPYFPYDSDANSEPRVDIEMRFFVPVRMQRFTVRYYGKSAQEIRMGSYLDPLEMNVELGNDRRSIVITVVTDRQDTRGEQNLQRSPRDEQKTSLQVTGTRDDLQLQALHAPLSQLLGELSRHARLPVLARPEVEDVRVSLHTQGTLTEILRTLASGLGLSVLERPESAGGGWSVGTNQNESVESVPLQHLSPENARLLLGDWLLPYLRVDSENNALIVSAAPAVVAKIRADLAVLDVPRPQVRVQATLYEVVDRKSYDFALQGAFGAVGAAGTPALAGTAGTIVVNVPGDASLSSVGARLEWLKVRGRARLQARPFTVVLSGETATLFLGQSRFVPVLRQVGNAQDIQALQVSVGYSLTVRPRVSSPTRVDKPEINLDISPRISTVDDVEDGTGLPTLGIREIDANVRVRDGDEIVIAGLDSDLDSQTRGRRILPSRRKARERTRLIAVVSAKVQ